MNIPSPFAKIPHLSCLRAGPDTIWLFFTGAAASHNITPLGEDTHIIQQDKWQRRPPMQYYQPYCPEIPEISYLAGDEPFFLMAQAAHNPQIKHTAACTLQYHWQPGRHHTSCTPHRRYHHCHHDHWHGCCPAECHQHCPPRRHGHCDYDCFPHRCCFPHTGCLPSPGCYPVQPCFPAQPCFPQTRTDAAPR